MLRRPKPTVTTTTVLCGVTFFILLAMGIPGRLSLLDPGAGGNGAAVQRPATPDGDCREPALGQAADFNLFLLGDLAQHGASTAGRMAVGGNATLAEYSVGTAVPTGGPRETLVVGGALTIRQGALNTGDAVSGGQETLENVSFAPNSGYRRALPIDFGNAAQGLHDRATAYGAIPPSGRTRLEYYSRLVLDGTASDLNVFAVRAADLATASSIVVRVPVGSTVLVNVSGETVSLGNIGFDLAGVGATRILYNFPEAKRLTLTGIGLQGSILAPWASIDFRDGAISGTVIGTSLTGSGQLNEVAFDGCIGTNVVR